MRRVVPVVAAVVAAAVLVVASIARVPAGGGAWCGGRYLGPGVQLKRPFARVVAYPPGTQRLRVERSLEGRDGEELALTVELGFEWDLGRLPRNPVDPRRLAGRLERTLANLDRSAPRGELGSRAEQRLRELLDALPVIVGSLHLDYPSPALEALRAAARPTEERVVVVGLDGFDWVLLDRLIAEGRCPTFARMKRDGAWGEIISHPPVLSPLIWTTIGTGRPPEVHGVLDFVVRDPATGKDVPITNRSRTVPAFWNILSDVGIQVDVVNWWASYPAEAIAGVMVSERVFYQLFGISPRLDDPANVSPSELLPEVRSRLVAADDVGYDEVHDLAAISRGEYDAALDEARHADNPYDNRVNHLRKILAVTDGVFNLGRWLLDEHPARLTALYVEGTDTIGHRFAHFLPPKLGWVSDADYARYHQTMARYYELVDRRLGELMALADPGTTWIVVADHGFYTGAARPHVLPDDFGVGAAQWHRMVGVFLAAGPHVRPGKIAHLRIEDVCRTLLWLVGAPASRELEGEALLSMMRPEWVAAQPPPEVASYAGLPRPWLGGAAAAPAAPPAVDQARVDELRALGYVGEGPTAALRPTASAGGELEAKATEPYNLGKIALARGDLEAAERHLRQALEIRPDFAAAMVSLAGVYRERGDHRESLRWILRALETGSPYLPGSLLLDFVREAEAADHLDRVLPALDMLRPRWGESSSFSVARAIALRAAGRVDEAEAELRTTLERDPSDLDAVEALLELAGQGRRVDVDRRLGASERALGGDLKKLRRLALLGLRFARPALAERILRRLLSSDPSDVGTLSNLAAALEMEGRHEEAEQVLARAIVARPNGADLRFNHAAILASLGHSQEALAELERAEALGGPSPRLVATRAKLLFRLGRIAEARAALERGAEQYPGDPEIGALLGELAGG